MPGCAGSVHPEEKRISSEKRKQMEESPARIITGYYHIAL